ncbi:uncharacterized protein [Amphiura filiformis]|uniref:uncharacterized protein n=1 Tax=Amphiura filiformis TaxID=82378 RepID=UPI003B217691
MSDGGVGDGDREETRVPLQDGYHHSTTQRQSTNISQKEYPSQKGFPTYIPEHQDTTYLPENDYGADSCAQYKKLRKQGAPDESVIVRAGQYERRPDNYLCLAIFVTCFCCLPFGICGVIHASQVKSLWEDGEIHDAKAASRLARRWSIAGLIFGALIIVGTVTGFAVRYMWNKWRVDFGEDGSGSELIEE